MLVAAPRTWGVVDELETLSAVLETVASGIDEAAPAAVVVADGEETTGSTAAGTEAAGRIKGSSAVLPSETNRFSSGEAKECQAKAVSEVAVVRV